MSSTSAPDPAATTTRRRPRLLRRLTALYSGIASLVLLFAALAVYQELVGDLDREDDVLLRENALLVDALLLRPDREPQRSLLVLDENRKRLGARRMLVRVVDGDGNVLVETHGMSAELPPSLFPEARDPDRETLAGEDLRIGDKRYRLTSAALRSTSLGGSEAAVQLAMDRAVDDVLTGRYRSLLLLVLVPGLLSCALLGHWMARRAIAPIAAAAARVAAIDENSLHARVADEDLVDELHPLMHSFNELLARLEQAFDRLRNFSAHLAHELRTPINNLCGEIETALADPDADAREVLRSARDEATTLSHVVEGLLFLAYAERPGARAAMQPFDLATLVDGVVEFFEPLAADAGVTLVAHAEARPTLAIDRPMVQRALSNLLANSLAFTPRGGSITITTRDAAGHIEIEVADTGCGIAPERLPTIFDGAYSAPVAGSAKGPRAGLGIGLSIVRSILRLHHGSVAIDSAPGRGCRVTLRFR